MRLSVPCLLLVAACSPGAAPSLSALSGVAADAKVDLSLLGQGDLLISEIMQNPSAVSDYRGEWFEVYNNTAVSVDLDGLEVSDTGGSSFTVNGTLMLSAGEYAVFTRSSQANGGLSGDYSWPASSMALGNGSDDLTLSFGSTHLDTVAWDNGATFPDPNGASMSLDATGLSESGNDAGAAWCEAVSAYGDGDLGTPGAENDSCGGASGLGTLTEGQLIVSEVMQNPSAVTDYRGEWFEVHNLSGQDLDLQGLQVTDAGGSGFTVDSSVLLADGAYALFTRSSDSGANGGLSGDYSWPSSSFALGNGSDSVTLSVGGTQLDTVAWDNGASFPDPNGASMSLGSLSGSANDSGASWCEALSAYGDGDLGTPGAANDPCGGAALSVSQLLAGDLVVSEVMQNPSAVTDYRGEWFELYNDSGSDVDLLGLVVSDDGGSGFTVDSSVTVPAGGYAVLARYASESANGAIGADWTWPSSSFALGNGSDEIVLGFGGVTFDRVAWDNGASFPDPNGASMSLDSASTDSTSNDLGGLWCEAMSAYGAGDLGTPGTANAACAVTDADGDGFSTVDGDCDDGDANTYPGADEVCDGVDNDCDGVTELSVPADHGTVGAAITASQSGDLVCVGAGTWTEHIDFGGKDITLRGAGTGLTRLDGNYAGTVVTFANGEGPDAVLEDLTVRRGVALEGAGLLIDGASPTLRDLVIRENECVGSQECQGAGAWIDGGDPSFTDVLFQANSFDNSAGVLSSSALWMGGVVYAENSHASFTDVDFVENRLIPWASSTRTTPMQGGVLGVFNSSDVSLLRVNFEGNTLESESFDRSHLYGGVLSVDASDASLQSVGFFDNALQGGIIEGGVVHAGYQANLTMNNIIMAGNLGEQTLRSVRGGLLMTEDLAESVRLENATLIGNWHEHDPSRGGDTQGSVFNVDCRSVSTVNLELVNVDVSDNGSINEEIFQAINGSCTNSMVSMRYTNVYNSGNGIWRGWSPNSSVGYTQVDGQLVAPYSGSTSAQGDYTLSGSSPLIDAGDPNLLDADGSRSDVGAYGGLGGADW